MYVSLEQGRWTDLPADVFVRGFVRSYARCVALDEDEMVKRYPHISFVNGGTKLTPEEQADRDSSHDVPQL